MPFIHIRSLPFDKSFKDFAKGTGIGLEHVTATWEYFAPGHYAVAGKAAQYQPQDSHPVLVDLLAPDFTSAAMVEKMLTTVSSSISKRKKVTATNIFIRHRQAHFGDIFLRARFTRHSNQPKGLLLIARRLIYSSALFRFYNRRLEGCRGNSRLVL